MPLPTFDPNPPAPTVSLPGVNMPPIAPPGTQVAPGETAPVPAWWADPVRVMQYILALFLEDPSSKERAVAWANAEFAKIRAGK